MSRPFLLDGRWVDGGGGEAEVRNPWNGSAMGRVSLASRDQVDAAIESAWRAKETASARTSADRSRVLRLIAEGIRERHAEFVECIIGEAGKPVAFAKAEVDRAVLTFEFAAAEALQARGELVEMEASAPGKGHFGIVRRFPIAPILGITPFNFPLNLVAHKVAPCIAAGSVMIVKPSLRTPLTALKLAEIIDAVGLPKGQIQFVPFDHAWVEEVLLHFAMLSFTGSASVGFALKAASARQRVALELGGNAAVIVEPDSDWERFLPAIANGAFSFAGQSCISVQRIFIHEEIYDAFREGFVTRVRESVPYGDPSDPATVVGPMIDEAARERIVTWIEEAVSAGARLLTEAKTEGRSLLGPVVLENVPPDCRVACEEAFAPVALLDRYARFEDALERVNASKFGLQTGIFTNRYQLAFRAFETLEVGGVLINQVPTFRVENMPYGGVKESGVGREGVRYAIEEMTEPRGLYFGDLR